MAKYMTIFELIEYAKEHDVDLDEAVHEAKADEAAEINNGSLHNQVLYLMGYDRDYTQEAITGHAPDMEEGTHE